MLFVNGIPLVVIECKRPDLKDALNEAISQQLRNHRAENIPHFFCLTQLLLVVSQNAAQYGTTATDKEFWAVWKEEAAAELDQQLHTVDIVVNTPPYLIQQEKLLLEQVVVSPNAVPYVITAIDKDFLALWKKQPPQD